MESIYFAEIESIKGLLFNIRQKESKIFFDSLDKRQTEYYDDFVIHKKLNDIKNKIFKEKKYTFFDSLSAEQTEQYAILDRAKRAYKSILKIEATLAINSLLKNEI